MSYFNQRSVLSKDVVKSIKEALWVGLSQRRIAVQLNVSQAAISHIVTGVSHANVPWPDGSLGAAPHHRPPRTTEAALLSERSNFEREMEANAIRKPPPHFSMSEITTRSVAAVDPELQEALWIAMEKAVEAEEEELLAQVTHVEQTGREAVPKPTYIRGPCVKWSRIKRSQGTTPLVLFVEQKLNGFEADKAKRIIGEIYAPLPAKSWHSIEALEAILTAFNEEGINFEL